jgi:hypothetical protein
MQDSIMSAQHAHQPLAWVAARLHTAALTAGSCRKQRHAGQHHVSTACTSTNGMGSCPTAHCSPERRELQETEACRTGQCQHSMHSICLHG